jgi:hypothetical protein
MSRLILKMSMSLATARRRTGAQAGSSRTRRTTRRPGQLRRSGMPAYTSSAPPPIAAWLPTGRSPAASSLHRENEIPKMVFSKTLRVRHV